MVKILDYLKENQNLFPRIHLNSYEHHQNDKAELNNVSDSSVN